ncbi:MAG: sigma-70 family RNA polymerase sigma factor [Phycisphaerales bacterium]|nr:sigma-70 family RNA polymerase sigma factor [Phycisphaerales bacterium]
MHTSIPLNAYISLLHNTLTGLSEITNPTPFVSKENSPIGDEGLLLLINQCKDKDRQAQKQLYDRFAPLLYAKIRRYVPETNHANEILNDSFFKILTHLENYMATGSFEGWIHRITINTIMDFLRKKQRHEQYIQTVAEDKEVPVPETTIGKMAYKELLALVHSLPDAQRNVFNLFVFDDCSHKEIAQLLDITENNSRWHLNDARRRLKKKLTL